MVHDYTSIQPLRCLAAIISAQHTIMFMRDCAVPFVCSCAALRSTALHCAHERVHTGDCRGPRSLCGCAVRCTAHELLTLLWQSPRGASCAEHMCDLFAAQLTHCSIVERLIAHMRTYVQLLLALCPVVLAIGLRQSRRCRLLVYVLRCFESASGLRSESSAEARAPFILIHALFASCRLASPSPSPSMPLARFVCSAGSSCVY